MITKALPPAQAEAVERITAELIDVMTTPLTRNKDRYLREMVAVARAAALGGEYAAAFKGYETIGKALGHIVPDSQSVHLHQHQHAHLTQASDAELAAMLSEASVRSAILAPAPDAPLSRDDATLQGICG